jgi:hypothetical protein
MRCNQYDKAGHYSQHGWAGSEVMKMPRQLRVNEDSQNRKGCVKTQALGLAKRRPMMLFFLRTLEEIPLHFLSVIASISSKF